jgi:hypothetical protein
MPSITATSLPPATSQHTLPAKSGPRQLCVPDPNMDADDAEEHSSSTKSGEAPTPSAQKYSGSSCRFCIWRSTLKAEWVSVSNRWYTLSSFWHTNRHATACAWCNRGGDNGGSFQQARHDEQVV